MWLSLACNLLCDQADSYCDSQFWHYRYVNSQVPWGWSGNLVHLSMTKTQDLKTYCKLERM